ncbi:MAG TPA: tetratricopeptide repeat protein [Gemmatimonadales bacterium]|nr:tetratricopeptide repeat protein [Gemmatimonadales bacterium]
MSDPANDLQQLRSLFDATMDQPAAERDRFLADANGSSAVKRQVARLIEMARRGDALLEPDDAARLQRPDGNTLIGQRLGQYRVRRLIGQGGMGAVYEAVRDDDQYQKRVAIKVAERGLDSELTAARFRRERQILASLEHPNIATLLDGGVTDDGRPFLVMEYIDGQPITTWCDSRALPVRERVAIFVQVCGAVQYAHRNLIVHRDLKPGNILVTADGTAKLLDFGIARLLDSGTLDNAAMPATRDTSRTYTPEYASPEQIRGDALTTATDVYSLGGVLYELLVGRRAHTPSSRALAEIERAVLHDPVTAPSTAVSAETAKRRTESSAGRLRKRLHGELDNIVLMAMRREPPRRYVSVKALDDDLRNYLDARPVHAQSDSAPYRLRKFTQRNPVAVALVALVFVAVAGGAIATARQARDTRVQEARAAAVGAFLRQLLRSVQPEVGRRDAQVSDVLDVAAHRVQRDLTTEPAVRAELESVIGESYQGLGRYSDAEAHLKTALDLRSRVDGPASPAAALGWTELGELYTAAGMLDSAETALVQAQKLEQRNVRTPDSLTAAIVSDLGTVDHKRGRPVDAERLHRQALVIQRRVLGDHSDVTALTRNDIAVALGDQGNFAAAEVLTRAALATLQANHPDPNASVADVMDVLASELDFEGKVPAADSVYRATLALRRQVLGAEHPDYVSTLFNYSMFIFDQKRYREAADYSREILALRGKTLPESHPAIAAALQTLGRSLDQLGDPAGGEKALLESLALRRQYVGPESWVAASSEGVLGEHYTRLREYPRAEQTLLHAQTTFIKALGQDNPRTQVNTRRLVALYAAWGRPEQAAKYQATLPATH